MPKTSIDPRLADRLAWLKWRFSMRTPDDPEYVKDPGGPTKKPDRD